MRKGAGYLDRAMRNSKMSKIKFLFSKKCVIEIEGEDNHLK